MKETNRILPVSMQDIMHNSMMPYAEYIIMERALPRVEDGLKPVQRRILYTMLELSITPDKPHRKSARIVGDAMGKYHPHGDSSIYDAMVRMSQNFNMRVPLVDGHGNFGSLDGDSAAAMRYTEARLAPIAMEMLAFIEKDTVPFKLNFDDSLKEPVLLPARFPNLLVNGATGIAIGLATNIPPHNLGEVIDGVVARIKDKNITLDQIMEHIKAPDFPTGGHVLNMDGLKQAYQTGKGKITIRAKTNIENGSNGKKLIVITETPYQVNKANMLEKILKVSEQRKAMFSGISDIRDESDRTGVRAVVEVKKGVDVNNILNCLYKYTDLQTTFGVNMVAIADGVPKQLSLIEIIDHYIKFQKDVVTRRTQHDLENAKKRAHILSGLIIAVNNIDEIIKIIRGSQSPKEAKEKLIDRFDLTNVQAQAILDMRLARLTALEVITLENEHAQVLKIIGNLEAILSSDKRLEKLIIKELSGIKDEHADARRTNIMDQEAEIVINAAEFEVVEDCVVVLTRNGLIKKMNLKSFKKGIETGVQDENSASVIILPTKTNRSIRFFSNLGNMYSINAGDLPESRWRDKGRALNTLLTGIANNEEIIRIYDFESLASDSDILFITDIGLIKRSALKDYQTRSSKLVACGLKDNSKIISIEIIDKQDKILLLTKKGMSIKFLIDNISNMGRAAKGVKAISLDKGDEVVFSFTVQDSGDVYFISDNGFAKRTDISEFELQGRAGKGLKAMSLTGATRSGVELRCAFYLSEPNILKVLMKSGDFETISTTDFIRDKRNTKGVQIIDVLLGNTVEKGYLQ